MKKAIMAAALVAFSFSGVANADALEGKYEAYKEWVQGDPDYWAKGGRTKAVAVRLKTNAGDLLDVKKLGRGGVPGALFAAGTYAASVVWEDELNELKDKSLFELFMGDNLPDSSVVVSEPGYYFTWYTYASSDSAAMCSKALEQYNWTDPEVQSSNGKYYCYGTPPNTDRQYRDRITRHSCSSYTGSDKATLCPTDLTSGYSSEFIGLQDGRMVPLDTSLTFPYNNGFSVFTNDQGEQVIITAEPNSFGGIDIINSRTTENAEGEEVTQESKIVMNGQGEIVSTSTGATKLNVNVSNPVNISLPDDYARENTLQSIDDLLRTDEAPDSPSFDNVINKMGVVEDSINDQEAPLISLPALPVAFAGSEACTGIDVNFNVGVFKMQAVFDKHCDIARDVINPILKWLFGFLAAWYCWTTYKDETTRSV